MRRLLEADLKRIMAKLLPWILLVIAYIVLGISLATGIGKSPDRNFFFVSTTSNRYIIVSIIIGFAVLLGVYGDEFKSMAMIGIIGRGISREKFVLAKFFDAMIISFQMVFLTAVYVLILKAVFGITLTAAETKYLVCMFVFDFISTVSYLTFAAIFYFLSENAAIGLFAYLSFQLIIPLMLFFVGSINSKLADLNLNRYYIDGLCSSAFSDFIIGDTMHAFLLILIVVAAFIAVPLYITMLIFRKKELEF